MAKAKIQDNQSKGEAKPELLNKPPQQVFSRFGKGPQFGMQKIQNRGQFTPPAIRITQNKGGGGK